MNENEKVQTSALTAPDVSTDVTPPLPGGGSWRMVDGAWVPNMPAAVDAPLDNANTTEE